MRRERRQPTRVALARLASPALVMRRISPAGKKKNFAHGLTGLTEEGERRRKEEP